MTRPKKESVNRRVIIDLSFPEGAGVNDGINIESIYGRDISYSLPSIQDLVTYVQAEGDDVWLWKADLSRAYRQLRVDPIDTPLLGLQHKGQIYINLCPSFGCRSSGGACQRTSAAVNYLMAQQNFKSLAFLDDFAGCEKSKQKANKAYASFIQLADTLGLQLPHEKCAPPAQLIDWLGYNLDAVNMTLSIAKEKLKKVLAECNLWAAQTKASKQMIQSLVGRLLHLANCVKHARKFTARILYTLRLMIANNRLWTTFDSQFKADLQWFRLYAEAGNGISIIAPVTQYIYIECDSSLEAGGGNSMSQCYSWEYPLEHREKYPSIHQLEAVNAVVAYRTLCPKFGTAGKCIVIVTDNLASAFSLMTGRTKDPLLATCARELWLEAAKADHDIQIEHQPGENIPLADALSRSFKDSQKLELAQRLIQARNLSRVNPVLSGYMFFNDI